MRRVWAAEEVGGGGLVESLFNDAAFHSSTHKNVCTLVKDSL